MGFPQPKGMKAFVLVWIGQVVSLMGSAMSGFALTIWAWKATNSATAMAIVGICNFLPGLLFSPIAGALVDRWNRKLVMIMVELIFAPLVVSRILRWSGAAKKLDFERAASLRDQIRALEAGQLKYA